MKANCDGPRELRTGTKIQNHRVEEKKTSKSMSIYVKSPSQEKRPPKVKSIYANISMPLSFVITNTKCYFGLVVKVITVFFWIGWTC